MNAGELEETFRIRTQDLNAPYLWGSDEFLTWLNEAENEACRRARLLVDTQSSICELAVSANDEFVELDPLIIYVRRAEWVGRTLSLAGYDYRDLDVEEPGWRTRTTNSYPRGYIRNLDPGYFRPYPIPTAAGTVKLTVVRLPLEAMTSDGDEPEINRRYHLALLDWVYYRCYAKNDADAFDPKKSKEGLDAFEREFGTKERASAMEEEWQRQTLPYDYADGTY